MSTETGNITKLSAIEGEDGYETWKELWDRGLMVDVSLDGKTIEYVISVDVEAGQLRRLALGQDGLPFMDNTNQVATEILHGDITLTIVDHGHKPAALS